MAGHDVQTCPRCGGLITPQLSRCRQCGADLHGGAIEDLIFEKLLPDRFAAAPGTGLLILILAGYFVMMVVGAGPSSILAMSSYSLRAFGALDSNGVALGQYWRFVTSALGHAGIVHIGFNLYALSIAGPVVERLFDRKRMVNLFLVAGAVSMVCSYGFAVGVLGRPVHLSIGASGAISGLIGAGWMGARRLGPEGAGVAQALLRWTGLMLIMGLAIPGVDNAAHVGGWLVGALGGWRLPLGLPKSTLENRALSGLLVAGLVVNLVCVALMVNHARGFPGSLAEDAQPKRLLGMTIIPGAPWKTSSQVQLADRCGAAFDAQRAGELPRAEAIHRCQLASRALPQAILFELLAALYAEDKHPQEAQRYRALARRLKPHPD